MLFKRKQSAPVDEERRAAELKAVAEMEAAWYASLPAANSVTACPKCDAPLLKPRKYQYTWNDDYEWLTVDCACGYLVREKTKDAS